MGAYDVDLKIILDATDNRWRTLDGKDFLAGLPEAIADGMAGHQKPLRRLRCRVIVFRDFAADGRNAFQVSEFFVLPDRKADFATFIGGIRFEGGGDHPENALEALAYALLNEWSCEGTHRRHVMLLLSDAPPHPYGMVTGVAAPQGLPATIDEVLATWRGEKKSALCQPGKRLYLIVPSGIEDYVRWAEESCCFLIPIDAALACRRAATQHIVTTVVYAI